MACHPPSSSGSLLWWAQASKSSERVRFRAQVLFQPQFDSHLLNSHWPKQSHGQGRFKVWAKGPCLLIGGTSVPHCQGAGIWRWGNICGHFFKVLPVFWAPVLKQLLASSLQPRFTCLSRKHRVYLLLPSMCPGRENQYGTLVTYTHLGYTHPIHTKSCLVRSGRTHPAGIVLPGKRWCSWPPGKPTGYIYLEKPHWTSLSPQS